MRRIKGVFILVLSFINLFCYSQINLGTTVLEETVVASDLDVPWDMTYGEDGWIWFTELEGNIRRLNPNTYELQLVFTVPDVMVFGFSAGMHSIVLHPNFNTSPYLYVHYTNTQTTSKIVRYEYNATSNTLMNPFIIMQNIPAGVSHNGSRMVIVNNKLFISLGDTYSTPTVAQNLNSINGKVLRMNLNGSVPSDNPISGSYVWSLGHRNPQGLCFANGKLYSSEHGTGANDEINIINEGRNYGWPNVEGECNTSSENSFCLANNVAEPIWSWSPSIAPCGLDFYQNTAIPEWNNSLLVSVLKNKQLIHLKLSADGTNIEQQNIHLTGKYGRLRDVLVIPDGRVFICTSNRDYAGSPISIDDRIIELKNADPLNIGDYSNKYKISVYPVPSDKLIFIDSNFEFEFVSLVGTDGKEVFFDKQTNKIDVSIYSSGVYYLKLLDSDKKTIETKKIIIN